MQKLDARVVVLTGAAGGLGRALAGVLYRDGYTLALVDIDGVGLEGVAAELRGRVAAEGLRRKDAAGKSRGEGSRERDAAGGPVHGATGEPAGGQRISVHCVDIAEEEAVVRMAAEVLAAHGRVDWLINNAAISISQSFAQMQLADLRRLFAVNYWGTIYCTKYLLPHLLLGDDSRLVNIVSGFALMGFPGKSSYGASKAAITSFSYTLRTELAGTKVRVCLAIPPPMSTGIVRKGLHIDDAKRAAEMRFLERHGTPPDKAAEGIVGGVKRGRFRIITDAHTFFIDGVARLFPSWLHRMIGKRKGDIGFY